MTCVKAAPVCPAYPPPCPGRRRARRLPHSASAPENVCNCASPGEPGSAPPGAACTAADAGADPASASNERIAEGGECAARGAGDAAAGEQAGQKHPARMKARAARAAARAAPVGGSAESSASDLEAGRCDAAPKGARPQKQKAQAQGAQAPQGAASAPGPAAPAEAPRRASQEATGVVDGAGRGGAAGRSSADSGSVWAGPGFCVPPAPERLPQPTASLLARR